jgi:pyruvate ferredoxin oxidoreductase gamma subunit
VDTGKARTMFQVRFHGCGGQGVVASADLLAAAALSEGRHAQAFRGFGSERMGAPVMSFCRIDDQPIGTREPVSEPDALIIQDPALVLQAELLQGLGPGGYLLINSARGLGELGLAELGKRFRPDRLIVMPASSLALTHLGRPLPSCALLGGFAALTWAVSLDSVLAAIGEKFTGQVVEKNAAAARAAFDFVRDEREALTHGQAGLMRRPVTRCGTIRRNSSLSPPGQGSTPARSAAARSASDSTWCAGPWTSTLQP